MSGVKICASFGFGAAAGAAAAVLVAALVVAGAFVGATPLEQAARATRAAIAKGRTLVLMAARVTRELRHEKRLGRRWGAPEPSEPPTTLDVFEVLEVLDLSQIREGG